MKTPSSISCRPPTGDEIVQDLGYKDVVRAHVLAFLAEIDDRPLYVESALVGFELRGQKWRMVHVFRHPREERHHWELVYVYDAYCAGSRDFDHAPTKAEAEEFMRDSWWHSRPDDDFRLVQSDDFPAEWKMAFGYSPKIPRENHH